MLKNQPLVSIIVPIYNAELYLKNCIDSIKDQTYSNLEIILVNDGSTDNSLEICKNYSNDDKRIIVLSQENKGVSFARNSGIEYSNGKYIMFVDSDDWLNINTISKAIFVAESKNIDLVFFNFFKEFEDKSKIYNHVFNKDILFEGKNLADLHRRICGPINFEMRAPQLIDSFISNWGKLYSAKKIKNNNISFVDTKLIGSEDIFFALECFGVVNNAYYLNEALYHYRKDNPNSLTKSNKSSQLFYRFQKLFEYMFEYLRINNKDKIYFRALNNRIAISMMNIGLSEVNPKIDVPHNKRINTISTHLNSDLFNNVYDDFNFYHLKLHWKLFYFACKIKNAHLVYFLLLIMKKFTNK
tara:strand:+ start:1574 stop:2641 length:1068 start_codon:yes stop_codon:yes gene_type:complete